MFAPAARPSKSLGVRPRVNLDACRLQHEVEAPHSSGILAAIEALPATDRDVLVLHYLRGLSEEAIARQLDLNRWVVRRRLQDAIQRLRSDATEP